jgi:protein gp37
MTTKIEWAERTWNPIVGCSLMSAGCTNCYAMALAWRMANNPSASLRAKYEGTVQLVKGKAVWTGKVNLSEKALLEPLRRQKPTVWFVNSMGDLFHSDITDQQIDRIFAVMALCPQHIFQVLTKRPKRMREYCISRFGGWGEMLLTDAIEALSGFEKDGGGEWGKPLPNVWLGTTIEDKRALLQRAALLKETPAALRFWSCEPLLGHLGYIPPDVMPDWVISGGESGSGARPSHPAWHTHLRDQCMKAGIPYFFKQWGTFSPIRQIGGHFDHRERIDTRVMMSGDFGGHNGWPMKRQPKHKSGRTLEGIEYNQMPAILTKGAAA